MKILPLVVLAGACRIGFEPLTGDGATTDATSDTNSDTVPTTTVTLGERSSSQMTSVTTDTNLVEPMPNQNWGASEDLSLAGSTGAFNHVLLRFDTQALAPGTPVVEARIEIVRVAFGDEIPGPIAARLLVETWIEGNGNPAANIAATWANRDTGVPWSSPGGTTSATVATLTPTGPDVAIAIDPAIVQAWIDTPAANAGILIAPANASDQTHYHFHSAQSVMADLRPQLVLALAQ